MRSRTIGVVFVLSCLLLLVGCDGSGNCDTDNGSSGGTPTEPVIVPPTEVPTIAIQDGDEEQTLSGNQIKTSVIFTAPEAWTAGVEGTGSVDIEAIGIATSAIPGWISINPASGPAGKNEIIVSLEANYAEDRTAQILIRSHNLQSAATVLQQAVEGVEMEFTSFDHPLATHGTTFTAINDFGQIVGAYYTDTPSFMNMAGIVHSFLKDGDILTPVAYPAAAFTVVSDINNSGQILGTYSESGLISSRYYFLKDKTSYVKLGYPDRPENYFRFDKINNLGQIAGAFRDADGKDHVFLKDGDSYANYDVSDDVPEGYSQSLSGTGLAIKAFDDSGRMLVERRLYPTDAFSLLPTKYQYFIKDLIGDFVEITSPAGSSVNAIYDGTFFTNTGRLVLFETFATDSKFYLLNSSGYSTGLLQYSDAATTMWADMNAFGQMIGVWSENEPVDPDNNLHGLLVKNLTLQESPLNNEP